MKKIFFFLAVMLLSTSSVFADEEMPELKDCERAQTLPKEASEDTRRIACNIPEDLQEQVMSSQFFGGLLRIHDIAAWQTTDLLKEAGAFKEKNIPGQMQGWLTFNEPDSINVRYFAKKGNEIVAFTQADLDKSSMKAINNEIFKTPIPATERELTMLRALNTAKTRKLLNCSGPFNSVVIPFKVADKEEIRIYLFSPWINDTAPLGGHHLLLASKDGSEITNLYSQTNSCVNFDPKALSDKNLKLLGISHLTSDTPTEMHVFMSLQYKKPIMVGTASNGVTWKVDGNKISLLSRKDGKKLFEPSTKTPEDK